MEIFASKLQVCWYDVGAVPVETSYGDELLFAQD